MSEITEDVQQELDNIYELICTGELNNIELAYELSKNYMFDINNWTQFFVRKSIMGSVSLYKGITNKFNTIKDIGYTMKTTYFTTDKAIKFYSENSKLLYFPYGNNTVRVKYNNVEVQLRMTNEPFKIELYHYYFPITVKTLDSLEQAGKDITYITEELKTNNVIKRYNDEHNQIEFYLQLGEFIKRLNSAINNTKFERSLLVNKLKYDWKNKTTLVLTYKYSNKIIDIWNFHSHNKKCSFKQYWANSTALGKEVASRRLDLLAGDYKDFISN